MILAEASPPSLKPFLEKLVAGESLSADESKMVCSAILKGAEPMQVATTLS